MSVYTRHGYHTFSLRMTASFSLKCRREGQNVRLQEILEIYHRGSGQLVNHDKSAVFFSKNSTNDMRCAIASTNHYQYYMSSSIPVESIT